MESPSLKNIKKFYEVNLTKRVVMTDPSKFCKDAGKYEKALSEGVNEMGRLFDEGYISYKSASKLWYTLLGGLYGRTNDLNREDIGNGQDSQ